MFVSCACNNRTKSLSITSAHHTLLTTSTGTKLFGCFFNDSFLQPAEATEDAKKENNSISKSPAKSKTVNETVAEAKKSPAKARDEKKSAGEINGEEVLKGDKPSDKATPEESQKDVPPVKSDKQSPSKQTDKPKAGEEGPAEEDMEVTQSEQSEDPAPSTPATQRVG